MTKTVENKTNNFITCFEPGVTRKEAEPTPPQLCIAYLERRGRLWTRFREEYADLFFELGTQTQRKIEQISPDANVFYELLAQGRHQEAYAFKDQVKLNEREEAFNRRLNPMLNYAFDLLVSWGASPESLRM